MSLVILLKIIPNKNIRKAELKHWVYKNYIKIGAITRFFNKKPVYKKLETRNSKAENLRNWEGSLPKPKKIKGGRKLKGVR